MTTIAEQYDVFVSGSPGSSDTFALVEQALALHGLRVAPSSKAAWQTAERESLGAKWLDQLRADLVSSAALFVVVTPMSVPSPWIPFEIGAASVWQKPVYVLLDRVHADELPPYLSQFNVVPISQIDKVAKRVLKSLEQFSKGDRQALIEAYQQLSTPADQIIVDLQMLARLTSAVQERTGKDVAAQRVAQELINLRKRGLLPRLNRKKPA